MLFNSYIFIFIFLPLVLIVYLSLNHFRLILAAKVWLFAASLFFYGWWNSSYILLLLGSILFNYTIAQHIDGFVDSAKRKLSKKMLLQIGLVFNIGLLSYFKYMDFFIENVNVLLNIEFPLLNIILPLAISFFTLQQVAFLIDVYEGLVKKQRFIDYALFVSFFPQLIAGPIVHHKEMMPQFFNNRNKIINYENLTLGFFIFCIGLFKKVVIADSFAVWATNGFDVATSLTFFEAWASSLCYTFQLYYDFSGYADMAIGIGLMFNIKIPINFNSPFKATNIINFWSRWHITLTNFITTYIYTPVIKYAPGKITFKKSLIATFIAMFISGIWHGAAWTFVVWGTLHGLALVINHFWRKWKLPMRPIIGWFLTFNFINLVSVIFRAKEWADVIKIYKGMLGFSGVELPHYLYSSLGILENIGIGFSNTFSVLVTESMNASMLFSMLFIFGIIAFLAPNSMQLSEKYFPNKMMLVVTVSLFIVPVLFLNRVTEFIYFNF